MKTFAKSAILLNGLQIVLAIPLSERDDTFSIEATQTWNYSGSGGISFKFVGNTKKGWSISFPIASGITIENVSIFFFFFFFRYLVIRY